MNKSNPFQSLDGNMTIETIRLSEEATRNIAMGVKALRQAAELPENAPYRNRFLSTACELSEVSQKLDLIQ